MLSLLPARLCQFANVMCINDTFILTFIDLLSSAVSFELTPKLLQINHKFSSNVEMRLQ